VMVRVSNRNKRSMMISPDVQFNALFPSCNAQLQGFMVSQCSTEE